ncbi:inositol monophosphatase family protein [Chloroflexota bacterium]
MTAHLEFALQLAKQTGNLLLQHFHSVGLKTHLKGDHSVVTEADMAADRLIADAIQNNYPDDLIVSEELQPSYPNLAQGSARATWVIDPLDGTTNFSLGFQFWGVLITRLVDGWPNTAVLYFPMIDECYSAQQGQGAYLNGVRLQIKKQNRERPQSFFACCSRTFRRYQVSVPYKTRILGSAAYTFCALAREVAVLGFESTPKIWDISGGWLLVQEAGGVIETLDGSQPFPLKSGIDYASKSFPTLAAADHTIADKAHQQIIPKGGSMGGS